MSEVLQANIFFFITGIAVIVFTLLLCIALYHLIIILKSVRRVIDRIEEGSEMIAEDFQNLRTHFAEEGLIATILRAVRGRRKTEDADQKRAKTAPKTAPRSPTKNQLRIKGED